MIKILSQEQLDELIYSSEDEKEMFECFVMFNGGLRSSRSITFDGNSYYIYNEIEDSVDIVKHNKLMDSFPIGEAIKKRALYTY